jgi:hypothetical protein
MVMSRGKIVYRGTTDNTTRSMIGHYIGSKHEGART